MGSKHRMECGATPTMHVGLDPKVNLIRDGMASQRCAREIVHPVQGLQQNFLRMKMDRKAAEMGQLYGSHMMMRRKMEEAILSRYSTETCGDPHGWAQAPAASGAEVAPGGVEHS